MPHEAQRIALRTGWWCVACNRRWDKHRDAQAHCRKCSAQVPLDEGAQSDSSGDEIGAGTALPADDEVAGTGDYMDAAGGAEFEPEELLSAAGASFVSGADADSQNNDEPEYHMYSDSDSSSDSSSGSSSNNSDSDDSHDSNASSSNSTNSTHRAESTHPPTPVRAQAARPPYGELELGSFYNDQPGVSVSEGGDAAYNGLATASWYPFANYTEAAMFLHIFFSQSSEASVNDLRTWICGAVADNDTQVRFTAADVDGAASPDRFCAQHMPRNTAKWMRKMRRYLPLLRMLVEDVLTTSGSTVQHRYFSIGDHLARLLRTRYGAATITHCKQAHTLTPAETAANRIATSHVTAIATMPADYRLQSPMHGQIAARSPFATPPGVVSAAGATAYIGDIVLATALTPTAAAAAQQWAVLRGMYWDCNTSCVAFILSPLVPAALVDRQRSTSSSTSSSEPSRMYEDISRSSERAVTADKLLDTIGPAIARLEGKQGPHVVGWVRRSSKRAASGAATAAYEKLSASARPVYFDMRGGQPAETASRVTAALPLSIDTDQFTAYGLNSKGCKFNGTYMRLQLIDRDIALRKQHTIVLGVSPHGVSPRADMAVHLRELQHLQRGAFSSITVNGITQEVSTLYKRLSQQPLM